MEAIVPVPQSQLHPHLFHHPMAMAAIWWPLHLRHLRSVLLLHPFSLSIKHLIGRHWAVEASMALRRRWNRDGASSFPLFSSPLFGVPIWSTELFRFAAGRAHNILNSSVWDGLANTGSKGCPLFSFSCSHITLKVCQSVCGSRYPIIGSLDKFFLSVNDQLLIMLL